jgi:thiol:disulfide interchange protein DsbD
MMKLLFLVMAIVGFADHVFAQNDVVEWIFRCHKISGKTYEITLQARVKKGWHIYSQNPGEGPFPTTVSFIKSSLIMIQGKLKEQGNLKSEHSEVFNSQISYYEDTMILVQRITLRANVKTSFRGNVQYMVCSYKQCLAPMSKAFNIALIDNPT